MLTHKQKKAALRAYIKTWGWRIKKAGYTQTAFAEAVGSYSAQMSGYCKHGKIPPTYMYLEIEEKLKELGV